MGPRRPDDAGVRAEVIRVAALAGVLLTACTLQPPVHVAPDAEPSREALPALAQCGYAFGAVDDRRPEAMRSGDVHGRGVIAPELVRRVTAQLGHAGVGPAGVKQAGDAYRASVDVAIMSAYGASKAGGSMAFTTVLRAAVDGREFTTRGSLTVPNWWGADYEVVQGLLRSMDLAIKDLAHALAAHCAARQ